MHVCKCIVNATCNMYVCVHVCMQCASQTVVSVHVFHLCIFGFVYVCIFVFQNEATFPLVRRDYYRKTIQSGLYINKGITLRPSSRI